MVYGFLPPMELLGTRGYMPFVTCGLRLVLPMAEQALATPQATQAKL
jgi:hypothetical protein